METITSLVKWLFIESIIGILFVAVAVHFLATRIKKVIPRTPNPFALAAITFLVGIFTVPSIPRYEFEKEALSQIEGKEWIKVISKTKIGDITEPLTLFRSPIGSIFIVMPNSPIEDGFREVFMRYGERTRVRMSDPDCTDQTIWHSEPDSDGVFRYTSAKAQPMSEQQVSIYCEYDWTKEKEALRVEMLKLMK